MESIDKTHRYFIQFMLKNGISTIPRSIKYCSKFENEPIDEAKLGTIINQINRVIPNQYFKIVFGKCEVTQEDLLIWLNMKNDELTMLQLNYTERELEYFQAILQEIINSELRKLMSVVCLNITSTLTGSFSRENGQKVLDQWISGGYFVKNGEFIHLGPRLILEFTSYLRSQSPNCICYLCSESSFSGKICNECDKMFHSYCIDRYMQNQTSCPNCKREWKETQVFKNIMDDETTTVSYSDDEAMNFEDGSEPGPSQRRTRKH